MITNPSGGGGFAKTAQRLKGGKNSPPTFSDLMAIPGAPKPKKGSNALSNLLKGKGTTPNTGKPPTAGDLLRAPIPLPTYHGKVGPLTNTGADGVNKDGSTHFDGVSNKSGSPHTVAIGGGGGNSGGSGGGGGKSGKGSKKSKGSKKAGKSSGASSSPVVNTTGQKLDRQQARETVAAQLDPQLTEYRQQIHDQQASGKQQVSDLGDLYRRLNTQIGANQSAGDQANAAASKSIGGNYDALLSQLNGTFGGATAATNSELSRLGLQAASTDATAAQSRDKGYLTGLAGLDKTNALSTSQSKSQGFDNLLRTLSSQAALSGTQSIAKVQTAAAQAVSDLRSKKGGLAATRRAAVDTLYRSLQTARTKAEQDAAQQQFMNQIAAGKLGIEQGNLKVAAGKLGVEQGKLSLDAQNSIPARDLKRAEALKQIHDANKPYTSSSSGKGYTGGLALLQGIKTGKNPAAQQAKSLALSLYREYVSRWGDSALTNITDSLNSHKAPRFTSLPQDVRGILIQALHMAKNG